MDRHQDSKLSRYDVSTSAVLPWSTGRSVLSVWLVPLVSSEIPCCGASAQYVRERDNYIRQPERAIPDYHMPVLGRAILATSKVAK